MKTLHHLRTSNSTHWALILVLWVIVLCLMKNMNVFTAACSVSESNNLSQVITENNTDNKAHLANQSDCHLSEQLLQFHFHQIDSAVINSLIPGLIIAAFLWFILTSHPIYHVPPPPKRRRHLELCTFQE